MREFLLISGGAVLGVNARYWLSRLIAAQLGPEFPWGTLVINITGSLVLGFLLTFIAQRFVVDPGLALALGTGFCGAYTTFSTFSVDTIRLMERGDLLPASLYASASLLGSIIAAYAGVVLARLVG